MSYPRNKCVAGSYGTGPIQHQYAGSRFNLDPAHRFRVLLFRRSRCSPPASERFINARMACVNCDYRFFRSIPSAACLRMIDRMCHSEESPQRKAHEESLRGFAYFMRFRIKSGMTDSVTLNLIQGLYYRGKS